MFSFSADFRTEIVAEEELKTNYFGRNLYRVAVKCNVNPMLRFV